MDTRANLSPKDTTAELSLGRAIRSIGAKVLGTAKTPNKSPETTSPEDSRVDEAYTINADTTLQDINDHLTEYLEQDLRSEKPLESNLLIYALKTIQENNIEQYDNIMAADSIKQKLDANPQLKADLGERVESLEYFKTKDYIFLIPKDQWEKRRTKAHISKEGSYLTPSLTAIIRHPVFFDQNEESDGTSPYDGKVSIFPDKSSVGKETPFFPFCKQLLEAEDQIQRLLGDDYHIPNSWEGFFSASDRRSVSNPPHASDWDPFFRTGTINKYGFDLRGTPLSPSRGYQGLFWAKSTDEEYDHYNEGVLLSKNSEFDMVSIGHRSPVNLASVCFVFGPKSEKWFIKKHDIINKHEQDYEIS